MYYKIIISFPSTLCTPSNKTEITLRDSFPEVIATRESLNICPSTIILELLNDKSSGYCHTFLDDIVGAIAAAAASRVAHGYPEYQESELD